MDNWQEEIKKRLKGKVALVACGNPLRGDDGLGPYVAEHLKTTHDARLRSHDSGRGSWVVSRETLRVFSCETAPENFISPIVRSNPQVVVVLDTTDFGASPGAIRLVEPDDIVETDFSTHAMSPRLFMSVIKERTHADCLLLAVQPLSAKFGQGLSSPVKEAAEEIIALFSKYGKLPAHTGDLYGPRKESARDY